MTNTPQRDIERELFEHWMTHEAKCVIGGTHPYSRGLERDYWKVWRAAWQARAAQATAEPVAFMCPNDPDAASAFGWAKGRATPKCKCGAGCIPLIVAPDRAPSAQLIAIGAKMANVLFNLAQQEGCTLTADYCARMDKLRKDWDAARAAEHAAVDQLANSDPAPQDPDAMAEVEIDEKGTEDGIPKQ